MVSSPDGRGGDVAEYLTVLAKSDVVLFDDLGAGVVAAGRRGVAFEGMLSARCRRDGSLRLLQRRTAE